MTAAVDQLSRGMQGSANGLREIGSGADDMRAGINGMRDTVDVMSGYLAPARNSSTARRIARLTQSARWCRASSNSRQCAPQHRRIVQRRRQTDDWVEYCHDRVRRSAADPAVDA
jgi:hypothetical protein